MAMAPTRRDFLNGAITLPTVVLAAPAASMPTTLTVTEADLRRYIGFGGKQSGGAGDTACGAWLEAKLRGAGFVVERQAISVPCFTPHRCELVSGGRSAPVWPQPIVEPTTRDGFTAPLVRVAADGTARAPLAGAIALVELPYGRWSSALAPAIKAPLDRMFAAGARAAVVVTNGPTGKVIALNTDGRRPLFPGHVALLAPDDAEPFLTSANEGATATLHLSGTSSRRPAFNLVGRRDRGLGRWLVISTPRSGWFTCAGERGGGIVAWLSLLRWASTSLPAFDLAFICNSGHEYEYLGAEQMLRDLAPPPQATQFWLHLGANVASRDWHEGVGKLRALPGTDSQRYLVVSRALLPAARRAFDGMSGLAAPYASDELSAGELSNIIGAGYPLVGGVFGLHRFHHIADDDARCVNAVEVARTVIAFHRLVEHVTAR